MMCPFATLIGSSTRTDIIVLSRRTRRLGGREQKAGECQECGYGDSQADKRGRKANPILVPGLKLDAEGNVAQLNVFEHVVSGLRDAAESREMQERS